MRKSRKRGLMWKNFLILMSCAGVLILGITFFIYQNAVQVMKEEILNVNSYQAAQVANNLSAVIERTNRLASSLCFQDDVTFFWGMEKPEKLDEDFYKDLQEKLETYVYSLKDYIVSISLYAPVYERILCSRNEKAPYVLQGTDDDLQYDTGWLEALEELGDEKIRTQLVFRRVKNSYPYVLTVVKQYLTNSGWGAVAIDIDLEKLYGVICADLMEDSAVWVLEEQGQIVVSRRKDSLYLSREGLEELTPFTFTAEELNLFCEVEGGLSAYGQCYEEELGLYVVSAARLQDFDRRMFQIRLTAVLCGIGSIMLACVLVWLYVKMTNKPIQSILGFLQNPIEYPECNDQSEAEVQEIVDRIMSHLQMNEKLRDELNQRVDLLRQTQLQALKAQINPHFLFNTLNVIVILIDEEVEDSVAAQVTADLADVLRYSLSEEDLVRFADEMEYTRKYVHILEQRYRGCVTAEFDIEDGLQEVKVPKLILQPLIENAVFHGIVRGKQDRIGNLRIAGRKVRYCFEQEEICAVRIEVSDNGQGMSAQKREELLASLEQEHISMEHIGLQNVAKRLALLFSRQSRVEILSTEGEGTCITLLFPYIE